MQQFASPPQKRKKKKIMTHQNPPYMQTMRESVWVNSKKYHREKRRVTVIITTINTTTAAGWGRDGTRPESPTTTNTVTIVQYVTQSSRHRRGGKVVIPATSLTSGLVYIFDARPPSSLPQRHVCVCRGVGVLLLTFYTVVFIVSKNSILVHRGNC